MPVFGVANGMPSMPMRMGEKIRGRGKKEEGKSVASTRLVLIRLFPFSLLSLPLSSSVDAEARRGVGGPALYVVGDDDDGDVARARERSGQEEIELKHAGHVGGHQRGHLRARDVGRRVIADLDEPDGNAAR